MERLLRCFTEGIEEYPFADTVGMEVETMFVDRTGQPMSLECSQQLIAAFQKNIGWRVAAMNMSMSQRRTTIPSAMADRSFSQTSAGHSK